MPIVVECDECGKKYRFQNSQAGARVPCHQCGHSMRVPGRKPGGGRRSLNPVAIGAGVGALAVAVVLIAVLVLRKPAAEVPPGNQLPGVAQGSSGLPNTSNGVTTPTGLPNNGGSTGAVNPSSSGVVTSSSDIATPVLPTTASPADRTRPGSLPGRLASRTGGTTSNDATTAVKDGWSVEVDVPATVPQLSQTRIQVPVGDWGSYVAMPQLASPFVAVRGRSGPTTTLRVFNLETLKAGKPLNATGFAASCPVAVSPDGKRVALITGKTLTEWSTDSGKMLRNTQTEFEVSNRLFEYLDASHIAIGYEHDIAVYDMSTAKAESVLISTLEDRQSRYAISPGGRYAAGYFPTAKTLAVYDLRAGKEAGQIVLEGEQGAQNGLAVAFSPEGDELMVVVGSIIGNPVLLNFDVKTGERLHRHSPEIGHQFSHRAYSGQRQDVQCLSGKRGWVLFARHVVERDSGQVIFTAAADASDTPWKVLPNDRLLVKLGDALRAIDISPEAINVKTTLSGRIGKEPLAEKFTALDASVGKTTALPDELIPWKGATDPGKPSEPIVDRAVLGYADGQAWAVRLFPDRRHMLLVGTESTRLVAGADLVDGRLYRARIVDLKTGDIVKELQPPVPTKFIKSRVPGQRTVLVQSGIAPPEFADISADGKLAASVTENEEVLIWSLVDGSEVARTKVPRGRLSLPSLKFTQSNQLLAYVSADRAATASVTCWDVPSLKRVYELTSADDPPTPNTEKRVNKVRSILAVSPNRRYAALDSVNSVRLIDTATGELRGDLPISVVRSERDETADQGLFSDDGKKLVALFRNDRRSVVYVWDLQTGRELSYFEIEGTYFITDWVSDDQLVFTSHDWMRSSVLVDINRHCIVWRLKGNRNPLMGLGNGNFVSTGLSGNRTQLGVVASKITFPDPAALREIKSVMPTPLPPIAGTGSQLKVEVGNLSGLEAKRDLALSATEAALRKSGMTVGTRDGLTLKISLDVSSSRTNVYEITQYSRFSPERSGGTIDVTSRRLEAKRELLDRNGQVLWLENCSLYDGVGLFFMVAVRPNESVGAAVQKMQTDNLASSFERRLKESLPRVIYPQPRYGPDGEPGIGSSSLYDGPSIQTEVANFFEVWLRKSDSAYVSSLRAATLAQQAQLAALESGELVSRLKWVPALKRPAVGVRWGFGVQLAQVPKESMLKTQANSYLVMDSLHSFTGGVGSQLVGRMAELSSTQSLGESPESDDARVSLPVLLGGGNRKQLIDSARAVGLDLVIIAHFMSTTTGKNNTPVMVIRLINADTEEEMFASDRLTNRSGAGTAVDVAGQLVDNVMSFAKEKLILQPLESATDAEVRERIAFLEKSGPGLHSSACVELLAWRQRQLISDDKARTILKKVTADPSFSSKLMSNTSTDRANAVLSLNRP